MSRSLLKPLMKQCKPARRESERVSRMVSPWWPSLVLSVVVLAGLGKPTIENVTIGAYTRTAESLGFAGPFLLTSSSGFFDFAAVGAMFANMLAKFTEAPVSALEKRNAAIKELVQASLNHKAAGAATAAGQAAVDLVGNEAPTACSIKRENVEAKDVREGEGHLARALTQANTQRALNTSTGGSSGQMRALLNSSYGDYCSPENLARGVCSGGVSPKNMPDADVSAVTLMTSSDVLTNKMSKDEIDAAMKFVDWVTNPIPVEPLPVALQKTPAGLRLAIEMRHRQAVMSSSQYALNRILASRSETK